MTDKLLTFKEVKHLTTVSHATLWRWIKIGKFPAPIRLGENTRRWHLSDVEAFVQRMKSASPPVVETAAPEQSDTATLALAALDTLALALTEFGHVWTPQERALYEKAVRQLTADNTALRAEVEKMREMQRTVLVEQGEDVARLRAENEKLRAALKEIVAMDEVALIEWKKGDGWLHQRVARAALEEKEDE